MKKHKDTKEYFETVKRITLSEDARSNIRASLGEYADFHAVGEVVRISEKGRLSKQAGQSPVHRLFSPNFLKTMKASLVIALLVAGGGTSFAAQSSVPGDFLYPVKIEVNERVRSALALGAESEARLQVALLRERLDEAVELAAKGELEGHTATQVRAGIAAQSERTIAASAEADARVQTDIHASLENALGNFNNRLAGEGALSSGIVADIASDLSLTTSRVAQSDGQESDDTTAATMSMSADTALTSELAGDISLETMIENAEARIQALRTTLREAVELSASVRASFIEKIDTAAELLVEAKASLRAGLETEAREQIENASELLGEVESSLSLLGEVEIDLETGSIIGIDLYSDTDINADSELNGSTSLEGDTIESLPKVEGGADSSMQSDSNIDLGL